MKHGRRNVKLPEVLRLSLVERAVIPEETLRAAVFLDKLGDGRFIAGVSLVDHNNEPVGIMSLYINEHERYGRRAAAFDVADAIRYEVKDCCSRLILSSGSLPFNDRRFDFKLVSLFAGSNVILTTRYRKYLWKYVREIEKLAVDAAKRGDSIIEMF